MTRRQRRPHWRVVLDRWWHRFVVLTDPTAHRRSVAARKAAETRKVRKIDIAYEASAPRRARSQAASADAVPIVCSADPSHVGEVLRSYFRESPCPWSKCDGTMRLRRTTP